MFYQKLFHQIFFIFIFSNQHILDDGLLFTISVNPNDEIIISLKNPLTESDIADKKVLQIVISAIYDETSIGSTSVIFKIPQSDCKSESSIFKTTLTTGSLTSEYKLNTLQISVNADIDPNVIFEIDQCKLLVFNNEENL